LLWNGKSKYIVKYFPLFLDINNRHCLVIGGGPVAYRKVNSLIRSGAIVTLIAPEVKPNLQTLADKEQISIILREYEESDLVRAFLVIAATNNAKVNARIAQQANAANILVNVADNPDIGSFIFPSVVDRSPVTVAISTGGASPVFARQLRMRLDTMIPEASGALASITEEYREKVKQTFSNPEQRKEFWETALNGVFAEYIYAGNENQARQWLDQQLSKGDSSSIGEVYLVGAGPGDPDLLTFKAVRLMQQADVMVYDRLVSKAILDMANKDAERLYVGKEKSNHAVSQKNINQILVDLAKQGKRVLRLKGGDPFIFGRGGEEIEKLTENNVPFQVVPAVTAASGCSAYAGIPLTHRDYSQSVTFATGHLRDGTVNLDWEKLTQQNQTVVFYMGLSGIAVISEKLQEHGMSADMPAALIEQGTTSNQRVHIGTVSTLPKLVDDSGVRAPTLTIIGEVVKLHDKLNWYEPDRHVQQSEFSRNNPP